MAVKDVIRDTEGTAYMLSNEAVVRYALESDVKVVSFYPGAPQTEILDTFEKVLKKYDFRMEVSANEKVALETVAGASFAGQRSLTSMKSVGTNVASDALYSLAYTGVNAGCVVLIADDPYAHSSQSEQDGRWFSYTAYLPMLEPSNPQEAGDMVKRAFELSEKYETMILVRTTTRVNHQSGMVRINKMERTPFEKNSWKEIQQSYKTVGAVARERKYVMTERLEKIREELDGDGLNYVVNVDGQKITKEEVDTKVGIITAGVCYNYVVESLLRLGVKAKVLKLGVLNPLPKKTIGDFISQMDTVITVEELFPFIENQVKTIAQENGYTNTIYGKGTGTFSENMEYNIPIVETGFAKVLGKKPSFDYDGHVAKMNKLAEILPPRLPVFCAGCPHRATFAAFRRAVGAQKNIFFANDIGCYSMMCLPPVSWSDSMLCMGASMGVSAGVQYSIDEKTCAFVGDSTFFHAALPGIVNIVHNQDDVTIFLMDNRVTAMTGQQSHPGRPEKAGGVPGKQLDLRKVVEGLGVEYIVDINAFEDVKGNVQVIKDAIAHEGPSVVISHGECALYHFRNYRHAGGKVVPFYVDNTVCEKRYACIYNFMCPAFSVGPDGHALIDEDTCVGCGVCAQLCPHGAIKSTATRDGYKDGPITTLEAYEECKNSKEVDQ